MQSDTSQAFGASLPFILRWEGGFVDDPDDRGGRTNKGVTQNVYHAWRADQGLAQQDVQQINDQEVGAIYFQGYWLPAKCDVLRSKLDLAAFDTAVNMGSEPGDQSSTGGSRFRRPMGCLGQRQKPLATAVTWARR